MWCATLWGTKACSPLRQPQPRLVWRGVWWAFGGARQRVPSALAGESSTPADALFGLRLERVTTRSWRPRWNSSLAPGLRKLLAMGPALTTSYRVARPSEPRRNRRRQWRQALPRPAMLCRAPNQETLDAPRCPLSSRFGFCNRLIPDSFHSTLVSLPNRHPGRERAGRAEELKLVKRWPGETDQLPL